MRRTIFQISVFLACLGTVVYWFLLDGRLEKQPQYAFDIKEIRVLANSIEGQKPTAIHLEKVAQFYFFRTLSMAGTGFDVVPMGVFSFQLITETGHFVIDAGYDEEMAASARADFYPAPYARMQNALDRADGILITHEHYDHIGGIIKHPDPKRILPRVLLTEEQVNAPESIRPRFPPNTLEALTPLRFEKYFVVAPGIVLIKAPGHTPGSVMIYVQLQSDQEFLFVGDIAWHEDAILEEKLRPRVITDLFLDEEDRSALSAQIRFLNHLHQTHPEVIQIAGHDNEQLENLVRMGQMFEGFSE